MSDKFDQSLSPAVASQYLFEIKLKLLMNLDLELNTRGAIYRSSNDDTLFKDFNTIIAISLVSGSGFEIYLSQLFQDIEEKVLEYEQKNSTSIHKGSIYFNIGLVYLWSGDFDNALYFWSKAEEEDILTYKQPNYNIFNNSLLQKNFGKILKNFYTRELSLENNLLLKLINQNFDYTILENLLITKHPHHLINILINLYKRVRYQKYNPNDSTNLLYYILVADYCIMFETELKNYLTQKGLLTQNMLGRILRTDLTSASVGNISVEINNVSNTYHCSSVQDYNAILNNLLQDIDSETNRLLLAVKLLHLITITRNQVAHNIDNQNIIYGNIDLCKRLIRLILSAIFFDKYV